MKIARLIFLSLAPAVPWALCGAGGLAWSGMGYELAGLFTVVLGLNARPTAVGLPPLMRSAWQSVRDKATLAFSRRRTVSAKGHFQGVAGAGAVGRVSILAVKIPGTLEGQLAELKERLGRVEEDLSKTGDGLRKLDAATTQRIELERTEREKADVAIEGKVKATALGDTSMELFGVVLFAFGAFLSTLSNS